MCMLLVVDKSGFNIVPDNQYRSMHLRGSTYTEQQYRDWVNDTWAIDREAPLSRLAKIAEEKGGWLTLRLMSESM